MGARAEGRAYRKGFVLGALVAAGATIWNAPQSGKRTREQIRESIEGVLFTVLDFPEKVAGARNTAPIEAPVEPPPVEPPVVVVPQVELEAEIGTDIVIDGPRPSELAR
jgi:hypothetical protein